MGHDVIFAVRRLPGGGLYVDWHKSLYDVIDGNGKDTDKLIDFAEEMLERLAEHPAS